MLLQTDKTQLQAGFEQFAKDYPALKDVFWGKEREAAVEVAVGYIHRFYEDQSLKRGVMIQVDYKKAAAEFLEVIGHPSSNKR